MATKVTQPTPQIKVKRELCSDEIKVIMDNTSNKFDSLYGQQDFLCINNFKYQHSNKRHSMFVKIFP